METSTKTEDYTSVPEHLLAGKLGDNGAKWAAAFCQRFPDCGVDEGTMLGWFANAIEVSNDVRARSAGDGADYKGLAIAQCSLLDLIEQSTDDSDKVRELCHGRFDLFERHGLTVKFPGESGSGTIQ